MAERLPISRRHPFVGAPPRRVLVLLPTADKPLQVLRPPDRPRRGQSLRARLPRITQTVAPSLQLLRPPDRPQRGEVRRARLPRATQRAAPPQLGVCLWQTPDRPQRGEVMRQRLPRAVETAAPSQLGPSIWRTPGRPQRGVWRTFGPRRTDPPPVPQIPRGLGRPARADRPHQRGRVLRSGPPSRVNAGALVLQVIELEWSSEAPITRAWSVENPIQREWSA